MELQRPLAFLAGVGEVEQLDERLADQRVGRVADRLRDGAGDVGQQRAPVGLPEPALARLLVVGEDVARAGLDAVARLAPLFLAAAARGSARG